MTVKAHHIILALVCIGVLVGGVQALSDWTSANGCWTATDGSNVLIKFNNTAVTHSFPVPTGITSVDVALIAGGGAGGGNNGGGGGAGGFWNGTITVTPGENLKIKVGAGGVPVSDHWGGNGSYTVFESSANAFNITGGGGGGANIGGEQVGKNGGSGGGGSAGNAGGTGIAGLGRNGGASSVAASENGGGGGNQSVGQDGHAGGGGQGGKALGMIITGVTTPVAGGGGGGSSAALTVSEGGNWSGTIVGGYGGNAVLDPTDGMNETGSGGGGHGGAGSGPGGLGGNGVVIIRYSPPTPVTSFTADQTEGAANLVVTFTDTSTNTPTYWNWSLQGYGYNTTHLVNWSTAQNPVASFKKGNFSISLGAGNSAGFNLSTQITWINVTGLPPVAAFSANVTTCYENDYVKFTDSSTNTPDTWDWGYGDGTANGTTQNPEHQYTTAGVYTVRLNASNEYGYDDEIKNSYITVSAVPVPVPSFTANKTYSTSGTLGVQFNVTSTTIHPVSFNWSFGDGDWDNQTVYANANVSHAYTSNGIFTVALAITNDGGTATTTSVNYVVVSSPTIALVPNPQTINKGIPQNISVQVSGTSNTDFLLSNVTYNKTSLQVKDVYPLVSGLTTVAVINNAEGFVTVNFTGMPNSSLAAATDLAYIKFNVTTGGGNTTEPLNIVSLTGVVPNTSYTPGLYTFNTVTHGAITPTDTVLTQTFDFYRSDTGDLLSSVQLTNVWDGITSGTAYTTTGSQEVSSTWGYINLTTSANTFYTNILYDLEIKGTTTNVYITPYVPSQTQTTFYTPHQVTFMVLDANNQPMKNVAMDIHAIETTLPGGLAGALTILQKAYGVSPQVAIQMLDTTTELAGNTDASGSASFLLLSTIGYSVNVTDAGGVLYNTPVYPQDIYYTIRTQNSTYTQLHNVVSGYQKDSYAVLNMSEPNTSYIKMQLFYYDSKSNTDALQFYVKLVNNDTIMYSQNTTIPNLQGPVLMNYTVKNTRGEQWIWKYDAHHPA